MTDDRNAAQAAQALTPEAEEAPAKNGKPKKSMKQEILEWVLTIVIPVVAVLLLHNFIFTFATVSDFSMLETLQDKEWIAVSRIHYAVVEPQRGDIVACNYPSTGNKLYVKRMMGLPGDTIAMEGGVVIVNGEELDEPYLTYVDDAQSFAPITLGEDQYFVMGDNRPVSWDSRLEGPLSKKQLYGFVMGAVYPFNTMRWFYR